MRCVLGAGVLVLCRPSMLLGQDLSFVSLSAPLSCSRWAPVGLYLPSSLKLHHTSLEPAVLLLCHLFLLPAAFKPPGWEVAGTCSSSGCSWRL